MQTIVPITEDQTLAGLVGKHLGEAYQLVFFCQIQSSLDYIYNSLPDLILIDLRPGDPQVTRLLSDLKEDPIFGQIPVLAVLGDDTLIRGWEGMKCDDYLRRSLLETDLAARVGLCILRAERNVEVSPLTRLPGNITIIKQIQSRLDRGDIFALAYADIDYFKPFNDKYGFSRGDEVLKMLGRLILNIVKQKQSQKSFVGHIGGDDFVFIVEPALAEEIAEEIIDNLDQIIPTFYDPEDRKRGAILARDRRGRERTFPLITLSIGVTNNQTKKFTHYGQMAEVASEMKKFAKMLQGSCCRLDRR
ncbi:MAG: GGDEF domain-containing protein [Desulfobacteraceae bacterium]|nr:MAG: GGDEF domain-containing protein [Desulfobacteraceae bacterium]